MSQPQSESYPAAKGGISALIHAPAVSFAGKVRVYSISPGWVDTAYTIYEGPDAIQQPAGRVGNLLDIANRVLFLASEKAGSPNLCREQKQTDAGQYQTSDEKEDITHDGIDLQPERCVL